MKTKMNPRSAVASNSFLSEQVGLTYDHNTANRQKKGETVQYLPSSVMVEHIQY